MQKSDSLRIYDLEKIIMSMLKDRYQKEVLPKMRDEFGYKNILSVPKVDKVVINVGLGDAKDDQKLLERIVQNITLISGQKAVVTKAKRSISGFKVGQGAPVGVMVTLRGEKMYAFLEKLFNIVLPKVRDFRGISAESFDSTGNFSLGVREQTIFPEISYQGGNTDRMRGLQISIVTTAGNKEQSRRLLTLLGMPFKES